MASELFVEALDTGLLGIIFSVAALPSGNLKGMPMTSEEERIVKQCSECVDFLREKGVHKNLLNVRNNRKLNVCRNILSNKNHTKTETLLKKFLHKVSSTTQDHENLTRLVASIRTPTRMDHPSNPSPFHVSVVGDTEWANVSISDTDDESVVSNVSDYQKW